MFVVFELLFVFLGLWKTVSAMTGAAQDVLDRIDELIAQVDEKRKQEE